jgi:citryl-CoA lyase
MSAFSTTISEVTPGAVNLRGYSLEEVMREMSYTDGAFLTLIGRLPSDGEAQVVDALMNSLLDHGFVASTITAARYIASGNPQFVPAVAGGLLAAGQNTLSPGHSFELLDHAARLASEDNLSIGEAAAAVVSEYRATGRRLPGLGHPTHKQSDFRAEVLFDVLRDLDIEAPSVAILRAIQSEFLAQSGKAGIPINIDGALAAVGRDLGWSVNQTIAFALLSVLPGLMAHVIEEIDSGRPLRHIEDGAYIGNPMRSLQDEPIQEGEQR